MDMALQSRPDTSLYTFNKSLLDKQVHGIMSNVISLLFRLNWNPQHIDVWATPQGKPYKFDAANNNITPLLHDIIDSYNKLPYGRAAKHYDGGGMEHGVEWGYTLSLVHSMRKSKEHC